MEKTLIEVKGVKLEVDLSSARVIDNYKMGENVKVLVKEYDSYVSYPGVIIGFDNFQVRPTIVIAYLKLGYNEASVKFAYLNTESKDLEICPMIAEDMPFEKVRVLELFDRQIISEEEKVKELKRQKEYFLAQFGKYFKDS